MSTLYNSSKLKQRRQSLRRESTYSEKVLWQDLRNKKINGVKFYRQFSVGVYICDFYCPLAKVAIELDGITHFREDVRERDRIKELFLKSQAITLLRFTDTQLLSEYDCVLRKIREAVCEGLTPPTPSC